MVAVALEPKTQWEVVVIFVFSDELVIIHSSLLLLKASCGMFCSLHVHLDPTVFNQILDLDEIVVNYDIQMLNPFLASLSLRFLMPVQLLETKLYTLLP